MATRPTTSSSSSSRSGSAWSRRVTGIALGSADARHAAAFGCWIVGAALHLGQRGAQRAAAAVVQAVDRRLAAAEPVGDLAGGEPDEVAHARRPGAAPRAAWRARRAGRATRLRADVVLAAVLSSSRTSSQGIARRWRMWSTATLRATRRIQAEKGTSRGSYLRQLGHQLREHVLRDVLGLVVVAHDARARSRRRGRRSGRTGSAAPRGRPAWRAATAWLTARLDASSSVRRPARRKRPVSTPGCPVARFVRYACADIVSSCRVSSMRPRPAG